MQLTEHRTRIGIFKTDVHTLNDKKRVLRALTAAFSVVSCTLDLEDCDRVLRVECPEPDEERIIAFLHGLGFQCAPLD